jgi:hypothetical protein
MSCHYRESKYNEADDTVSPWCIRAYRVIEDSECDGCQHYREPTKRQVRQVLRYSSGGNRGQWNVEGHTDEWPAYWRR